MSCMYSWRGLVKNMDNEVTKSIFDVHWRDYHSYWEQSDYILTFEMANNWKTACIWQFRAHLRFSITAHQMIFYVNELITT